MFSCLLAATALVAASVVSAETQQIVVGMNMTRSYTPNTITANVGDVLNFTFVAGNHSVSQSSFSNPCKDLSNGTVFSGYMPANITAGKTSSYQVTINDTNPVWIYCAQGNHCQLGMVLSVNAPTSGNMTFSAFQGAANATGANTTSTSSMSASGTGGAGASGASASAATSSKASAADVRSVVSAFGFIGTVLTAAFAVML
ncbi:uncharacterized protein MKK02DRAFT_42807 [Dioszegia hungarica]|uniref:Phytocyanin domain-containing protein n=1 Tax=Dioszegia hungarica TaxID=4972 RepID=A0AA38LY49_9TREE|nr:uncharacterized protein MKK02DRAFT_42807 [Dioszegia hungarica]KAI9638416.1 hypothetical protein MKK02DRAFT_42807 [Dioszegia hungarica]